MVRIVILAAGKGTRMNSELPKVLVDLQGRPMIKYLLDSVVRSGLDQKPLVIVSPDNQAVISQALSEYNLEYIVQIKQLGTGHAVACAQSALEAKGEAAQNIVVLYGDHPFLKSESIKNLAQSNPATVTIMPLMVPNFSGWLHNFYHWGRIVRQETGRVSEIKEFKDASEAEKSILELNTGFMCFNREWLFKNISNLTDHNQQKEYYLTDMVKIAVDEKLEIKTVNIEPEEAMGINSLEELKIAENILVQTIN